MNKSAASNIQTIYWCGNSIAKPNGWRGDVTKIRARIKNRTVDQFGYNTPPERGEADAPLYIV